MNIGERIALLQEELKFEDSRRRSLAASEDLGLHLSPPLC
jgi:hypothetical protein